ncbi:hypothetical protein [Acinetobacter chinensis]|jgi:hypothetical protein|uniref:hypothetical protein n=1 Tax=Acinetobacter chinensis TaxID=2004650 RepID=UPI0029350258|nr:hypothetical protein [Acinetobacter chinensis]WOE43024.1 hypothetical protein QSG87_07895 [Acinetobacter chinensis]
MTDQNEILERLGEDELFEIAEYGIQSRIDLRLEGTVNDDPQFLYDALAAIEDMNAEQLKACIRENSSKYQQEK